MKFYHLGNRSRPVILLLPGTCCHWQLNFGEVIPLLEAHFRVVCVSYDDFDETKDTVFPDMHTETEKLSNTYGNSLMGTFMRHYGDACGYAGADLFLQQGTDIFPGIYSAAYSY